MTCVWAWLTDNVTEQQAINLAINDITGTWETF
jgi:hypothetical protein